MNSSTTRYAVMAFIALALTIGAYAVLGSDSRPNDSTANRPLGAGSEVPEATDATEVENSPTADGDGDPMHPTLAALDEAIASAEARAAERDDDWIHLEIVANHYIDRARASGDWEDFAKADDAIRRAYDRAPEGAGPHLAKAALDYAMHRLPEASEALDALEAQAVVPVGVRGTISQLRADIAFHSGRYPEAKAAYEALLEDGRSPSLLIAYAQWHWKTGDLDQATVLLAEAESTAEGSRAGTRAWVYLVRGLFALERGAYDEALVEYRRGLRETPESWLHEEHIAEILVLQGEVAEASSLYESVIERTANPELMDALAGILRDRGQDADADALVLRARTGWETRLALFPEAAYGHAIGHWLELEDDPERTVQLAEANSAARPNGESKTLLAEAYLGAQRSEDAERTIREVLDSAWDTAEAHAAAARIYAARDDETEAAAHRERALALNPRALD
ncbi:MAG: hypothetical protein JRH11_22300 [Deltaproteobacteria bacterium]|nr:hypothetical protein [Deltaproteobacteria bacterium]